MSDAVVERNAERQQEKNGDDHLRQVESELRDDYINVAALGKPPAVHAIPTLEIGRGIFG